MAFMLLANQRKRQASIRSVVSLDPEWKVSNFLLKFYFVGRAVFVHSPTLYQSQVYKSAKNSGRPEWPEIQSPSRQKHEWSGGAECRNVKKGYRRMDKCSLTRREIIAASEDPQIDMSFIRKKASGLNFCWWEKKIFSNQFFSHVEYGP